MDLEAYEKLLEDLDDLAVMVSRNNEPFILWEGVKKKLKKEGLLYWWRGLRNDLVVCSKSLGYPITTDGLSLTGVMFFVLTPQTSNRNPQLKTGTLQRASMRL